MARALICEHRGHCHVSLEVLSHAQTYDPSVPSSPVLSAAKMANVNLAEDNGSALVGTAISFLGLTYFSVALRTYVRLVLTRNFQLDDWLMLVAQVGCLSRRVESGKPIYGNADALTTRPSSLYHVLSFCWDMGMD